MTQHKIVLIIGGSKGIGLSIAEAFAKQGHTVIVSSRHKPKDLKKLSFIACDVTKPASIKALMNKVAKQHQRIDVLVNCAGASAWKPLTKIDPVFLTSMMAVNLYGAFYAIQAAVPFMTSTGSIINVASLAGKRGSANNSVYCAAKFGLVGATQALAKELGPQGIRVNGVCPVYVTTDAVLSALKDKNSPAAGVDVKTYLRAFTQSQTALKRLPQANEVADLCVFLASPQASAITGQNINIDCGVLPQ